MCPAAGYVVTDGLPDRILTALRDNAGEGLRLAQLSRLVYPDAGNRSTATLAVGSELSRLYRAKKVRKVSTPAPGRKRPYTFYYLP